MRTGQATIQFALGTLLSKYSSWHALGSVDSSHIFSRIKILRDGKSFHAATLLSRLRQAPGELISHIPHFKHLPYVPGKHSHTTYHFLFFFHWFMFCLEQKQHENTSLHSQVWPPPWNSSITFLVFYLCKQKSSSNQHCFKRLHEFQEARVSLTSFSCTSSLSFSPLFFKSCICLLVFFKFI
jgi:hypothetical protein